MLGLVRKSTGSWYEIIQEDGSIILGQIKGKLRLQALKSTNPIAVGDHVDYEVDSGVAQIKDIEPRKNHIIRKANNLSRQTQTIAANLDQVLVVATVASPRTSPGFIDRVLLTAEAYSIPALIVFNKSDIYTSEMKDYAQQLMAMYAEAGYECHFLSVFNDESIKELEAMLDGKITLVTGHSGVGKSSLLNRLAPGLTLKTSAISNFSMKGKHTTTFAEMHRINDATYVIDTPGIKDFGIFDMDKAEISHYFPEMRRYLGQCRFTNCLHINEPGCAVIEAVKSGDINPGRYHSYLSILQGDDTHH